MGVEVMMIEQDLIQIGQSWVNKLKVYHEKNLIFCSLYYFR